MSRLGPLFAALEDGVRRKLPVGFEFQELPADRDGERFALSCQGDGWSAVVTATIRWRALEVSYAPHGWAGYLVRHAEEHLRKENTEEFLKRTGLEAVRGRLSLLVDDRVLHFSDRTQWLKDWRSLEVRVSFPPFVARDASGAPNVAELQPRMQAVLGLVGALVPALNLGPFADDKLEGVPDGAKTQITVNRYERDPANRAACIAALGSACKVCGFDFGRVYGPIGVGFIHVHHLDPVAQLGGPRRIDPAKDLVPVCPNCHAMLHRRTPPFAIDELKLQVRK